MDLDPVDDFTHTADSDEVIVMVTLQFKHVRQIECYRKWCLASTELLVPLSEDEDVAPLTDLVKDDG